MPFRPVTLPATVPGKLWLHSMPGRLESWGEFLEEARRVRLGLIVCLNPLFEVQRSSPVYHEAIERDTLPCALLLLPMRDFGLGDDGEEFRVGVERTCQVLREGGSVLLHCAHGIGRTGTMAACTLKALGLPTLQALTQVRDAGSNPQSAVQTGWIHQF
ncbi:MAG: tyrosine-protein phosphatase [Paucibacter sp.]|nr:tyrosine-protein phosphatase [Roseateles sp.]